MATATTCDIKTPPTMFLVTGQADRHGQPIITVRERSATQKAVFSDAKGYLLTPKRRPFTRQKVTFYKTLGNKDLQSRSTYRRQERHSGVSNAPQAGGSCLRKTTISAGVTNLLECFKLFCLRFVSIL